MRRDIEERALNAWPALETLVHDGWLLRSARGHTKRANSATPLYAGPRPPEDKIAHVEDFYARRGLPAIVRLAGPPGITADLDERLARRGYRLVDPTSVRLLQLPGTRFAFHGEVILAPAPAEAWMQGVARLAALGAPAQATLAEMMRRVPPERAFAGIWREGRLAAAGLGVLEAGAVGLFEIVTDPQMRRQGLARRVVESILAWAAAQGATEAYLQVVAANGPAIALYDRLGFRECHAYHYRVGLT
ncbi:MAG: GNAT family N-acetyltransferase [Alphaproteobacteria bacterium]|nr:GNAT family N-acetyltransferase [Alphaproteobacteria bacterium]